LAARAIENPEILATLSEADLRLVMAALIETAAATYKEWISGAVVTNVSDNGARLLNTKEMADRLHCSVQTLARGLKAGRYPFAFKNGAFWFGNEDGLERWIAARVKRQSHS